MSSDTPPPAPTLAIGATVQDAAALHAALLQAGVSAVKTCHRTALVRETSLAAPQQIIAYLPQGDCGLLAAMADWHGLPPCPVVVIATGLDDVSALAWVATGVSALLPTLDAATLGAQPAFARTQHERPCTLRDQLAQARAQLDERKWVDRAKGLLMAARSIAEDDAFRLHRGAAMQANLKLAEVSRDKRPHVRAPGSQAVASTWLCRV